MICSICKLSNHTSYQRVRYLIVFSTTWRVSQIYIMSCVSLWFDSYTHPNECTEWYYHIVTMTVSPDFDQVDLNQYEVLYGPDGLYGKGGSLCLPPPVYFGGSTHSSWSEVPSTDCTMTYVSMTMYYVVHALQSMYLTNGESDDVSDFRFGFPVYCYPIVHIPYVGCWWTFVSVYDLIQYVHGCVTWLSTWPITWLYRDDPLHW